jgi:aminoglycoside 6'-N-acetyltransferase
VLRLRDATLDDVGELTRWDRDPVVRAASGEEDEEPTDWAAEIADADEWTRILIAEVDGRPIGTVQLIDPALEHTHYWGDVEANLRALDIWIGDAEDRGRGYGSQMMALALQRCFAEPQVVAVLIDPLVSNTDAHRFYQRLGFVPVGERTFGSDRCLVHRLERGVWNSLRSGRVGR